MLKIILSNFYKILCIFLEIRDFAGIEFKLHQHMASGQGSWFFKKKRMSKIWAENRDFREPFLATVRYSSIGCRGSL